MARISLKEQYDNQSVIKQIADLGDKVDGWDEQIDQVTQTANSAKTTADAAKAEADAVKSTADDAKSTADAAELAANAAMASAAAAHSKADAATAKNDEQDAAIEGVKKIADSSLADVTIETDETSASLLLKNNAAAESSKAVPLASENATGMMTKATYLALVDAEDRIAALEGKHLIVFVEFTSDDPSQEEITNLFTAKTGKAPVAGNEAIDIARSLAFEFSGELWIKTSQGVAQWTNATAGVVKGTPAGTENAGTIFAETDGTGSVNGWDDLVARVANNESAISTTIPETFATKSALEETDATVTAVKESVEALAIRVDGHDEQIVKVKGDVSTCFDDVTASSSELTFTRVDGTEKKVTISGGSEQTIVYATRTTDTFTPGVSTSTATAGSVTVFLTQNESKSNIVGTLNIITTDLIPIETNPYATFYLYLFTTAQRSNLATQLLSGIALPDGVFKITFIPSLVTGARINTMTMGKMVVTISDGEITSVSQDFDLAVSETAFSVFDMISTVSSISSKFIIHSIAKIS